ncbi:TetR family transcriptional regulator [Actinosynnema sp. ALI-1.44]|uniref:TetR/AcrR family transcriptional regulator n=1 Tax=Actinosynnema sp. ALI-1.44 TaxID=1933779 RepID=UPI00097BBA85|nr:TetR family transcriptional regulator [Actinosynnema sp. ALI-1.44]ONI84511.1 TetR family transcriptional regulator [Actinosynnema sp. ALI-1.44]
MSGLRERKKRATREALSWEAVRLAAERGLENVLVEDIAAAAGVSPRTFNNYFASKYEAIVWREVDRIVQIGDILRGRPPDEPFWESIEHAVLAIYNVEGTETPPSAEWTEGVRRFVSSPSLAAEFLKADAVMTRALAEAIADRLGMDVDRDMYPSVVAGSVAAARAVAQTQWINADPPVALGPLIREALGYLVRGGEP